MENKKSQKRQLLEQLNDSIHYGWLKDVNRTDDMVHLISLLRLIVKEDKIESFFEDKDDFAYFTGKFTSEVLENILKQHYWPGEKGDEVALEVLVSFIALMLKHLQEPSYADFLDTVSGIFDSSKAFYRGMNTLYCKSYNPAKFLTADTFNANI